MTWRLHRRCSERKCWRVSARHVLHLVFGFSLVYASDIMSTPQDSPRIKKLKTRRAKQLAVWRIKQAAKAPEAAATTK